VSESMNLGTIRSQVQTYLMNTSTDTYSLSWPTTELNYYINEGVFYTQQITQFFEQFANIICTSSVSTYTAPNTVYQFGRFTWDRVFLPQTNEYELDRDDPSWRQAPVNNPFRFYFPQFGQQPVIAPYPTPSQNGVSYSASQETGVMTQIKDDSGNLDSTYTFTSELGIVIQWSDQNGSIIAFYSDAQNPFVSKDYGELQVFTMDDLNIGFSFVRIPDTMVLDTDTPQLPVQCHLALVFYTLMKCFLREGEFQDMDLAKQWFMVYGDWMESILENKARWWSTRVRSLEPFEEGSLFAQRLNAIGFPLQLDLKPSYGA